jgi:hypothetical protein
MSGRRALLALFGLVAIACADGLSFEEEEEATELVASAPPPLDDERFAFCHDRTAVTGEAEKWCGIVDDLPEDACPALAEACAEDRFAMSFEGCNSGGGDDKGRGNGFASGDDDDSPFSFLPDEPRSQGCDSPSSPGEEQLLKWLAALFVATLVLFILRQAFDRLGWLPKPPEPEPELATIEVIEGDDDLPALPEEELFARAQAALERADLGEAVVYARGAALRRLARRGLLVLHRARTDREYLRRIRRDADLTSLLTAILTAVEDHRWAGRELTRDKAAAAVAAAGRIVLPLLLLALALVPLDARANRYGTDGDIALRHLLEDEGWEVDSVATTVAPDDTHDLVVVDLTGVPLDDDETEALLAWVEAGGLLVLAGGNRRPHDVLSTQSFLEFRGPLPFGRWAETDQPMPWLLPVRRVVCPDPSLPVERWILAGDAPAPVEEDGNKTFEVAPVEVVLDSDTGDTGAGDTGQVADYGCEDAMMYGMPWGEGYVVRLADSRILWNAGLLHPDNQALVRGLVPWGHAEGLWDLPEPGTALVAMRGLEAAQDPLDAISEAKLLPFVLQLLLCWLALALWRGWPFAPRRDPAEGGRQAFRAHAVALGTHWHRLGDAAHAARAYAALIVRRLGENGIATSAMRHGYDQDAAKELASRAARQARGDAQEDLTLVEELWNTTRHR